MARGALGKDQVEKKIIKAFGADYIATIDKKIYVWSDDGGDRVQIAISMTCPKTQIESTTSIFCSFITQGFPQNRIR